MNAAERFQNSWDHLITLDRVVCFDDSSLSRILRVVVDYIKGDGMIFLIALFPTLACAELHKCFLKNPLCFHNCMIFVNLFVWGPHLPCTVLILDYLLRNHS